MPYKNYSTANLDHALVSVKNGEMTAYKASKLYKVPYQTLSDKLKNRHSNPSGHATVFTKEEEKIIVKWIDHMAKIGFPVTREQLLHSVGKLVKELNRPNPFKNGVPGRHWYEAFMKRNANNMSSRPDTSELSSDNEDDHGAEQNVEDTESIGDTSVPDEYYNIPTATHIDYACGACGSRIDGFRYSCVQCADYDQCAKCEASGAHAEHYVLRVPRVERATELQTVLDRVRHELKQIIPVKLKLEEDDEETSVVIKEEVEEVEMEPEEADPLQGAGAEVVKREDSDTDSSDTTSCGQVSVDETAGFPTRVSEASSTQARTRRASNIRARAGNASGRSAVTAASETADTGPEAVQFAAMKGVVNRVTEATDVPLRAHEASNVQARAGASRRRPPASKLVNTPAPTGHAGEQPRDSKGQAGASRDVNLSELSTFLNFDSMTAPRKRRKKRREEREETDLLISV